MRRTLLRSLGAVVALALPALLGLVFLGRAVDPAPVRARQVRRRRRRADLPGAGGLCGRAAVLCRHRGDHARPDRAAAIRARRC